MVVSLGPPPRARPLVPTISPSPLPWVRKPLTNPFRSMSQKSSPRPKPSSTPAPRAPLRLRSPRHSHPSMGPVSSSPRALSLMAPTSPSALSTHLRPSQPSMFTALMSTESMCMASTSTESMYTVARPKDPRALRLSTLAQVAPSSPNQSVSCCRSQPKQHPPSNQVQAMQQHGA